MSLVKNTSVNQTFPGECSCNPIHFPGRKLHRTQQDLFLYVRNFGQALSNIVTEGPVLSFPSAWRSSGAEMATTVSYGPEGKLPEVNWGKNFSPLILC